MSSMENVFVHILSVRMSTFRINKLYAIVLIKCKMYICNISSVYIVEIHVRVCAHSVEQNIDSHCLTIVL